jgi:hypothetical protein
MIMHSARTWSALEIAFIIGTLLDLGVLEPVGLSVEGSFEFLVLSF